MFKGAIKLHLEAIFERYDFGKNNFAVFDHFFVVTFTEKLEAFAVFGFLDVFFGEAL